MTALSGINQFNSATAANQMNAELERNTEAGQNSDDKTAVDKESLSTAISEENAAIASTAVDGTSTVTVLSDGDLLELSAKGVSMAMAMDTSAVTGTTSAVTGTTSEDDTSDLSNYSEYELSKMLSEGTISAGAYNAEIRKRQQAEAQQQFMGNGLQRNIADDL
ncbi:hypothetical protein KHM83_06340 [Fusibacter paucivorans]|uniref:Uncharacterized protein n=1 Tax=Fusibacter paucivorans TaxID=76009 RepID=A0ABS5PM87_9FIRM|nr:hypothetical protein [Fusibacter paucivorans]MBS7526289.1 hypothetical protein [Fusibacter paucivorans]